MDGNREHCEDMELIRLVSSGDEMAFNELYSRYRKRLYGYLNGLLPGRAEEVDDIFQQTWLRVIEQLPRYRDQGCFTAWLFRIGRNLTIDRLRKSRREGTSVELDAEEVPELDAPAGNEPWRELDETELHRAIDAALASLPPEQKEVFLMRQEEMPFREIAALQRCSINTVLARMQYALKHLRAFLSNVDRGGLI